METWLIVLGLVQVVMLAIGLVFFMPKKVYKTNISQFYQIFKKFFPYIAIIFGVAFFQLLEVNLIDRATTEWVGTNYAPLIHSIEDNIVYWFSQHWTPALVYFLVFMYIAIYPFTLWFSPLYFLLNDEKKSMKTLAYGLLIIYVVALPFYLFVPITNVYKFYGLGSALNNVIPSVENFFYSVTTQNNTFPSLHTAMTIMIAWTAHLTRNKKFTYFAYFCAVCVIISVIYLAVHWIMDVISGAALSIAAIFILNHFIKEK